MQAAGAVARQVLTSSSSLIQEAALSKFPAVGSPATVHHSSQSLVISKHTQKPKRKMSTLQVDGDDGPEHGMSFNLHDDGGNYQPKLITQRLRGTPKFKSPKGPQAEALPSSGLNAVTIWHLQGSTATRGTPAPVWLLPRGGRTLATRPKQTGRWAPGALKP